MAQKFSSKTPIRLREEICEPFAKAYAEMIEEHGATYTVNRIVADHLRSRGLNIPEIQTSAEKISRSQARRWGYVREENEIETEKERRRRERAKERARERRRERAQSPEPPVGEIPDVAQSNFDRKRELKRLRDQRYRARKRAAKTSTEE